MIALDASVAIAFLSRNDAHHGRASAMLAMGPPLGIHVVTLGEVLVGGVRIGRAEEMQARLTDLGVVELPRQHDEAITLARLRVETGLKLPDCCVLLAAESEQRTLATFDQRLATAARARGLEVVDASPLAD